MSELYDVIRHFKNSNQKRRVLIAVTLEEAQAHCSDPETSSSTCTLPQNKRRTRDRGPWFDGYTSR